jgi:beta-glucosidase-like glycosyl hydrolase
MEYDSWCSSGYEFNRELGAQMGEQSKRLGLQFNFAPVLDIKTLKSYRFPFFFGEDKYKLRSEQ